MLPHYVLKKTEEDRLFFYSHKGFYNFWGDYLILNLGYSEHLVLVNRTNREFHGGNLSSEEIKVFINTVDEHVEARLLEEMFRDFTELDRGMIWGYEKNE